MKVMEQHVFWIIDGTTDKVSQFIMTMKLIYKKIVLINKKVFFNIAKKLK